MRTTSVCAMPSRRRILLAGSAALIGASRVRAAGEVHSVAVVPQFPALEIVRHWTPLIERVSQHSGHRLQLVTSASIPEFEALFREGRADFAYLNPYHAVMARRAQKYVPLVREQQQMLTGLLVARVDGPVRSIADLAGRDVAFPAPNAFGASLYMRALLAQSGVPILPRYVKTHSNAYRHVITGAASAAGGVRATWERETEEVRQALTVIFETPPAAPHPLVAHPRVAPAVRAAVQAAFVACRDDAQGRALLEGVQMPAIGPADYARDYAPLERLGLDKHVVLEAT